MKMKLVQRATRLLSKLRWKHWLALLAISVYLLDYFGIFLQIKSRSYRKEYTYPLEGRILSYVEEMKKGGQPNLRPIYNHNYRILKNPKHKCMDDGMAQYVPLRLVYIVKSAVPHFHKRQVIRKTWGYENRFSDVPVRTVFLLGQTDDIKDQAKIEEEHIEHKDLIQGNFMDRYYNNSIKTAMGLRWAAEQCSRARFYMFVDDDYYVSTRNLLRFLRNPVGYPKYLEEDVISFDEDTLKFPKKRQRRSDQSAEDDINHVYNDYLDFHSLANEQAVGDLISDNASDLVLDELEHGVSNNLNDSLLDGHSVSNSLNDSSDNISTSSDLIDDNYDKKGFENHIESDNIAAGSKVAYDAVIDGSSLDDDDNKSSDTQDDIFEDSDVFQSRKLNQLVDFDLPEDVRLFAGQVFPDSSPMRHKSSKWYVTLEEYPFDRYPPFITAGAYVLSRAALIDMYYTSYFTKLFRFDDIWLGMIAKKADLQPFHSSEFYLWRRPYTVRSYRYVVASHGFENEVELQKVWEEQKMAGNA